MGSSSLIPGTCLGPGNHSFAFGAPSPAGKELVLLFRDSSNEGFQEIYFVFLGISTLILVFQHCHRTGAEKKNDFPLKQKYLASLLTAEVAKRRYM